MFFFLIFDKGVSYDDARRSGCRGLGIFGI